MSEESSHSNFGQSGAESVEELEAAAGACDKPPCDKPPCDKVPYDKPPYEKPVTVQIGTVVSMTQGRKGRGFIDNGSGVSK